MLIDVFRPSPPVHHVNPRPIEVEVSSTPAVAGSSPTQPILSEALPTLKLISIPRVESNPTLVVPFNAYETP